MSKPWEYKNVKYMIYCSLLMSRCVVNLGIHDDCIFV